MENNSHIKFRTLNENLEKKTKSKKYNLKYKYYIFVKDFIADVNCIFTIKLKIPN